MNSDSRDVPEPEEGGTDVLGPEAGGTDVLGHRGRRHRRAREPRPGGTDEFGTEAGGTDEFGTARKAAPTSSATSDAEFCPHESRSRAAESAHAAAPCGCSRRRG